MEERTIHNVGIILLVFSVFSLMIPFSQTASAQVSDGTVKSFQKISDTQGGFTGGLVDVDVFGRDVVSIGDIDGDGINDIAVGSIDHLAQKQGVVWILFMNDDGTVRSQKEIASNTGGFTVTLAIDDFFSAGIANLGDLDGNGVNDLAVGAPGDGPTRGGCGGSGAVYILYLNADGTVLSHTKIANGQLPNFGFTLEPGDCLGFGIANMGDIDGVGPSDIAIAVGANLDDDGGFDAGAVYIIFLKNNDSGVLPSADVVDVEKLSNGQGGLPGGQFVSQDVAGRGVANLGDLDGNGVNDLAVCSLTAAPSSPTLQRGKIHMLFLNDDGTVDSSKTKIITSGTGGFTGTIENFDFFCSVENIGDINGDGVIDLAVGARGDDDGGSAKGAVWILFLNSDGTVNGHQKISDTQGGFTGGLDDGDAFGFNVANLGDLDGDGVNDLAVGTPDDDDGGNQRGAVWILFMNGVPSIDNDVDDDGFDSVASGGDDCNDGDDTVFPGATELVDGQDNDCNGTLPSNESDVDSDTYVEGTIDAGGWDTLPVLFGDDCNDGDDTVFPGAIEAFNGVDDDCDGTIDEGFTPQEGAETVIDDIQDLVDSGDLNGGQGNALSSKLENIIEKLDKGQTNAVCNQLGAFVNQVESFIDDGTLSSAEGQPLLDKANLLISNEC